MISSPKNPSPATKPLNVEADHTSTNQEAIPVPYFAGRLRVGVKWCLGGPYRQTNENVKQKVGKKSQTVGSIYRCDIGGLICAGPVRRLWEILVDGERVHVGQVDRDESNPLYADIVVPGIAEFRIHWGTLTQGVDTLIFGGDCPDDHPPYKGICWLACKQLLCGQDRTTVPNVEVMVEREPSFGGVLGGMSEGLVFEGVNPVTALAEILTSERFGLGLPANIIHTASWSAEAAKRDVATALPLPTAPDHVAILGFISPFLVRQVAARAYLGEILAHFDGWLRRNGTQIELGSFPHNGVVPGGLTELSHHDLVERPALADAGDSAEEPVTQINVKHLDRERGMKEGSEPGTIETVRDELGAQSARTESRLFLMTRHQARLVATELAAHASQPVMGGSISVRRGKAGGLRPGDLFQFDYEPYQLDAIFRVLRRRDPALGGDITLEIQSERGLAPLPYTPPPDARPNLPVPPPVAVVNARLFQVPTAFYGEGPVPIVVPLIERPSANTRAIVVWFSLDDATYDELERVDNWAIRGSLAASVGTGDATLTFNGGSGFDLAKLVGQSAAAQADDTLLLFVGNEILSVGAVTALGGNQYSLAVLRGRRGSAVASHTGGAIAWVIPRVELVPLRHAQFPRTAISRWFKFQALTAAEIQALSGALKVAFTFADAGVPPPSSAAAGGQAEAIFVQWVRPDVPDLAQTEIFERSASSPAPGASDIPEFTTLGNSFFRGGLAAGTQRWYWLRNRDTIGEKSSFVGPVTATALAAPTGPAGPVGPAGPTGPIGPDGQPGPGLIFRGPYENTALYYHTAVRRDIVEYGGTYYLTNNLAKNGLNTWGLPGGADWTFFAATFESVATKLLLAFDATILRTLTLGTTGGDGIIQSGNYNPGVAGFKLHGDGSFEANEARIRGRLTAGLLGTAVAMFHPDNPDRTFPSVAMVQGEDNTPKTNLGGLATDGTEMYFFSFHGWGGTGFAENRFGRSNPSFMCVASGDFTPSSTGGAPLGGSICDCEIIYRVGTSGPWLKMGGQAGRAVYGNGFWSTVGGVKLSGLTSTDEVQFGLRYKSDNNASQMNVSFLDVLCLNF